MQPAGWNADHDTGHDAVDAQHRELFRLHGDASQAARGGDAAAALAALHSLLQGTREHFAFEERLMTETAYPRRDEHAAIHADFVADLASLVAEAGRDACSGLVRLWLDSRYASWWRLHVRANDAALARHVTACAALAAPPAGAPAEPGTAPR
jgi:hemerythrin